MKFSSEILERIKDGFLLSEVIGKRIKLERKGKEFLGLCPFHNERSPSFTVNDDKKFYHCFGCAAHGDVIKYTSYIHGISFSEAVMQLAQELGIQISNDKDFVKREQQNNQKFATLYQVMKLANDFFNHQLRLAKNHHALDYFHNRLINDEVIEKFSLGFAPNDRNALTAALKAKGVTAQQMVETGLVASNDRGETYDRFRDRIIFPIIDTRNRVIAFGGRTLGNIQPKYLNSPETTLFKKSDTLYALNIAKEYVAQTGRLIVVEGYMDVIAMHRAGFNETVASLGTAVTDNHIKMLWKLVKEPIFCLDGDAAGKRAMRRVAEHVIPLLKPGYSLRFAFLPQGKDPDEVVNKYGKEVMENLINSSVSLADILWEDELALLPKNPTPEQKAGLEAKLNELTDKISNNMVKNNYRYFFNNKLWQHFRKIKTNNKIVPIAGTSVRANTNVLVNYEHTLVAIILSYPSLLSDHVIEEDFTLLEFYDNVLDKLRLAILEAKGLIDNLNCSKILIDHLEKEGFNYNLNYVNKNLVGNEVDVSSRIEPKLLWSYSMSKYRLSVLEEERRLALEELTESALEKAVALKENIEILHRQIRAMDELFDE